LKAGIREAATVYTYITASCHSLQPTWRGVPQTQAHASFHLHLNMGGGGGCGLQPFCLSSLCVNATCADLLVRKREWWLVPDIKIEVNGDPRSTFDGGPSLVGLYAHHAEIFVSLWLL
jgi:hypothetical protein